MSGLCASTMMTVNQEQAQQEAAPAPAAPAAAPAQVVDPSGSTAIGAYSQREFVFHEREGKGELSFEYIVNDGQPNHLIWCDKLDQATLFIIYDVFRTFYTAAGCGMRVLDAACTKEHSKQTICSAWL